MGPTASFERYLRHKPDAELRQLAEDVEKLIATPGWKALLAIVSEDDEKLERELLVGKTMEQADYARVMGFRRGIQAMPELARVVLEIAAARQEELEEKANAEKARRDELAAAG